MRRKPLTGVLATAIAGVLTGCGVTAADLPLPGGGGPADSYRLNAVFHDALNLPEKAHVKLDGVDVGIVDGITAKNFTARVTMRIAKGTRLPVETKAELRQATPLGDVYIALHTPDNPMGAKLRDGDTLNLGSTSAAASVEDTLAALSTLINGGGLGQLRTIVNEMNAALEGNPEEVKGLIRQLDSTLATLNSRTRDIDRVINAAQSMSELARKKRSTVDSAFRDFTPAMQVLHEQTGKLTRLLRKVDAAAADGDRILAASRGDLTAMLRDLLPTLEGFADLRGVLGPTLRGMVTLGKYVEGISEGEAGAGLAVVSGISDIPGVRGRLPGEVDLRGGARSIQDNIGELVERLGGNK